MSRKLKIVLNESNPNKLPDACHALPLGDALGLLPRSAKQSGITLSKFILPDDEKAALALYGFATAGTTTGPLVGVGSTKTLATGEFKVDAKGDLEFFGADAVTAAEVNYIPVEGTVYEHEVTIASGSADLPGDRTATMLISATNTSGGTSTPLTVVARGTTPGGATEAAVATDGSTIAFDASLSSAIVKYVAFPADGPSANLEGDVDL